MVGTILGVLFGLLLLFLVGQAENNMAERVGFEPTRRGFARPLDFQSSAFDQLSHLSAMLFSIISSFLAQAKTQTQTLSQHAAAVCAP
jgi:ABC-type lipoprotein release transport system permease subunit